MGIKTNELPAVGKFSANNDIIVNSGTGTGRMSGSVAAEFFGGYFDHAPWLYDGVDLTVKFADEIAAHSGNPWAWYKARLQAHNLVGINPKDYIPFTTKNGNYIVAQVAGHNQYLNFNDAEITGWHTDFISKDLWPDLHVWNKVNYNNGLSGETHPYMCSDLRAWLNSLKTSVPNADTVNPATVEVDYTNTGVLDKLPDALKSVIVNKRVLLSERYNGSGLLTDDNNWGWCDLGKLWVPAEMEVYGCCVWGTKGYSQGAFAQYPIFRDSKMRIKHLGNGGSRYSWWLMTPISGNSVYAADVGNRGLANRDWTTLSGVGAPVCFRIAE